MPAQTIFFVGDKFHYSQTAPSVYSVSSTAAGYNREAVRDTSWLGAWKPSDSAGDEYLQIDGGSAGWIGTSGTVYFAIAYDARGSGQSTITITEDTADAVGGTFATTKATFTLVATAPTVAWASFTLSSSGRRYYRIMQTSAARTGTVTTPIYVVAVFTAAEVFIMDTGYLGNSPAPGDYGLQSNVGVAQTVGGMLQTNVSGPPHQEFDVNVNRATTAFWDALTTHFMGWHGGPGRAYWLQYDGIYNAHTADFGMVHQLGFQSRRPLKEQYDTRLRFRTCGKPL